MIFVLFSSVSPLLPWKAMIRVLFITFSLRATGRL